MRAEEILNVLDHYDQDRFDYFTLGVKPSELIDARMNVFRNERQWAIVFERLGCMPRAHTLSLDIFYYGNCIINREIREGNELNSYNINMLHPYSLEEMADYDGFLKPHDGLLIIKDRGTIPLFYQREVYESFGFPLQDKNTINLTEAFRFALIDHGNLFRATEKELYKCLPADIEKIIVLDAWYHRDYYVARTRAELMRKNFDFNYTGEAANEIKKLDEEHEKQNRFRIEFHRPSVYETWQMIAKALEYGDTSLYKPTLKTNTHWSNWIGGNN